MGKLLNILSKLNMSDNYIAAEIGEVEDLVREVSESVESYQEIGDETKLKTKEIEQLKNEQQIVINKIREREKEYLMNVQKLQDVKCEHECLLQSDAGNFDKEKNEILMNLDYKMKLFGIEIQAQYIEPTVYQAKINFAEDKFVIFNCDIIRNTYDLQAIEPKHSQCEDLRNFLLESRDIVGFLYNARRYFARQTQR